MSVRVALILPGNRDYAWLDMPVLPSIGHSIVTTRGKVFTVTEAGWLVQNDVKASGWVRCVEKEGVLIPPSGDYDFLDLLKAKASQAAL